MLGAIDITGLGRLDHGHLWDGKPAGLLSRLADVLDEARTVASRLDLREARLFAAEQLGLRPEATRLSCERLIGLWARFERFAGAHGVHLIGDVTPALVEAFVRSLTKGRSRPAVATMHLRRASIRLLFKILREFGLSGTDPTADLVLPPRNGVAERPLTDLEVERGRWASLSTTTATRQPALWALGEAGASTREMAKATCSDLDLAGGVVWLRGGPRTDARLAPLTEWGATQLGRRVRQLQGQPEGLLAFDRAVNEHGGRISAGATLSAILARAGLADDRDVKPRSLVAWVGRRVWLETGRIDEAARRLGMRSLDLTAELIGLDWRSGQGQA